jgi:hypothetical protein
MTAEIDVDLPCEESVFDAAHPFTKPDFTFERSLTAKRAFQALFNDHQQDLQSSLNMTMLDTFVSGTSYHSLPTVPNVVQVLIHRKTTPCEADET